MQKMYNSEEEFLREYDLSIFEKPSVTADIVVFSVSAQDEANYRKLTEKKISILLIKRDTYPFKDKWCLPGGFVEMKETLEEAAHRILLTETNMKNIYLEQLYTFSDVNRDPRTRVISTTYVSLIDKNKCRDKLSPNTSWFDMTLVEDENKMEFILDNGEEKLNFSVSKVLRDNFSDMYEYTTILNSSLAFDHPLAIATGISRLKNKIEYTDIVFNMMPEYFTLSELQQVYEAILGKKLLDAAFRRIIADKVEKTDKLKKGGGYRPSAFFKFAKNKLN